jgi:hypothetical protein
VFVTFLKEYLGTKPGQTVDVDPAHPDFLLGQGLAKVAEGDPPSPLVTKTMEQALGKLTDSLSAAVDAALQQFADAQAQSRRVARPLLFGPGGAGDPQKSFGDWCLAVARGDRGYLEKHYGSQFVQYTAKAALGEASGVTGGYTVPPDFYNQLLAIIAEKAIVRPRAWVQPMASATLQFPYLDVTTIQAAGASPFRSFLVPVRSGIKLGLFGLVPQRERSCLLPRPPGNSLGGSTGACGTTCTTLRSPAATTRPWAIPPCCKPIGSSPNGTATAPAGSSTSAVAPAAW